MRANIEMCPGVGLFVCSSNGVCRTEPGVSAGGMILRVLRLNTATEPPLVQKSLNFALYAPTNRTGDTWHIQIDNLRNLDTLAYAWEAQGELGWRGRRRYAPGSPLLDPYATLARPVQLPDTEAGGLTFLAGAALT